MVVVVGVSGDHGVEARLLARALGAGEVVAVVEELVVFVIRGDLDVDVTRAATRVTQTKALHDWGHCRDSVYARFSHCLDICNIAGLEMGE